MEVDRVVSESGGLGIFNHSRELLLHSSTVVI